MIYKHIKYLPVLILGVMLIYSWATYVWGVHILEFRDWIGLVLFGVNILIYCFSSKYGVMFTGVVLVLGTFVAAKFLPALIMPGFSLQIGKFEFRTPRIEIRIFLVLILYITLNKSYWSSRKKE